MNNYTILHLHSDMSNGTTNIDSITKFDEYIKRAADLGMTAIAFSEHGNLFSWVKKKETCEKYGLKYIHGCEIYITESLTDKKRDNYHTCLYAKNYDGVKEINQLISNANNREDGHFYYVPRVHINEFLTLSDNIIVTSACLGGVLNSNNMELKKRYIEYFIRNKDRCFFEIQHHIDKEQVQYNKMLYNLSEKTGVELIIGTDTHCLNETHFKARSILQKAKNIHFDNEDSWDIIFKDYYELIKSYEKQGSLPMDIVMDAIRNTNLIANMVEEFTLDRTAKYPKMYDDSEMVFKQKIVEGIKWRGVAKYDNFDEYKERIQREIETYKYNGAIDFMLLEEDYKREMRSKGVYCGPSRGSVSGSEIAYLLGITDMDSIKHKLNFERFMSTGRISLADVDSDWDSGDREIVKEYLYNKHGLYCCDIITFNTIALKGAIRDISRALGVPLDVVDDICSEITDENKDKYAKQYPDIFEYVDVLYGTIVSVGVHPAGVVVSPFPVDDWFGTFTSGTNKYPISQINMKEIDGLNFVKLDILGLDNVGIINKTCALAGIDRLTPDNVDPNDWNVWKSIRDNTLGVFQWESDFAQKYLKELFSESTISKIKAVNNNFSYMDLFSIGNSALRPAGMSYRDLLANGEFRDNGHPALNEFMSSTLGYLVMQETLIEFLNRFCGFTMAEADMVRRGFAKKTGTEQFIPKIKEGFINTMLKEHNVSREESEVLIVNFLRIIEDASDYLFSLNHSQAYSYIGYMCGYLRYYYPLEFITTLFNYNAGDTEKTDKIKEYCNELNIGVNPPKFRYSKGEYFFDKDTNSIYRGIGSIKGLGVKDGDYLYSIRNNHYATFLDLYEDIKPHINTGKVSTLIKLDYFSEFGKSDYLLKQIDIYNTFYDKSTVKKENLTKLGLTHELVSANCEKETAKQYSGVNMRAIINYLVDKLPNIDIEPNDRIKHELEVLGYIQYINPNIYNQMYLSEVKLNKYGTPFFTMYNINNGKTATLKVNKKYFIDNSVETGDIIAIVNIENKPQRRKDENGEWQVVGTEKVLESYRKL